MFLLCLKGGQKGRRYFSFPISAHRAACSVTPGSLTLSLANLFYRMVFSDSNVNQRRGLPVAAPAARPRLQTSIAGTVPANIKIGRASCRERRKLVEVRKLRQEERKQR